MGVLCLFLYPTFSHSLVVVLLGGGLFSFVWGYGGAFGVLVLVGGRNELYL
jgi:hypothetical protein